MGLAPIAAIERIRKPHRKEGQFVFIAVLLHWSKFSCLPGVPRACQTHLSRSHGTKRHPSQSFPRVRRTTDRLLGENRSAPADSLPPQSCRLAPSQCRPASACLPASPPCREAMQLSHSFAPAGERLETQRGRDARPFLRLPSARLGSPRSRQAWLAWEPSPLCHLRALPRASPPVLLVFLTATQPSQRPVAQASRQQEPQDWLAHAAQVRLLRAKSLVRELLLNA